jgi:uncharacterized protein (DUF1778 family)
MSHATQNPPLSVRLSPPEREMLEAAAALARTNLSDFVRRKALEAAEAELIVHPRVTIPAADWEKFEAWAHSPARQVPALAQLAAAKPVWQD